LAERLDKVFDIFTLVLGIFIGAVVAAVLGLTAGLLDRGRAMPTDEESASAVAERIAPVGTLALLGDEELAAAAAAITAAAAAPATAASNRAPLSGPEVVNTACYLCHSPPGVPGAPVIGDAEAWAPRIAKGLEVLEDHAINGFTGDAATMPPKGGRVDLSDDEVRAAVEYMIEQVPAQ
jgi:cytochrome c5